MKTQQRGGLLDLDAITDPDTMVTTLVNRLAAANGQAAKGATANGKPTAPKPSTTVSDGAGPKPATPEPNPSGRDTGGRFAKGNKAGKGNPFARKLGAFRSAFLDATSAEDVAALAQHLHRQALAGNVAAASLYLAYAIGKPQKAVDVDRLDLDEFRLLDDSPGKSRLVALLLELVDPALAVELILRKRATTADEVLTEATKERSAATLRRISEEMDARTGRR